ncbi:hypothetical protein P3T40_003551 [Paraburkholderia sp. EB58]|uniref:hypothetical protein n=1 Tax=Paraburkholderia sp. EB58 TaxID=3035125 RepID=UPI003D23C1C3
MFNKILISATGSTEYTPAEVSTVLEHAISRRDLLTYAALRLCGHDTVAAACAAFDGIEGSPEALGAVGAFFEKDQAEQFAALVDHAHTKLPPQVVRLEWKRLQHAAGVAANDSALAFRLDSITCDPFPKHRAERAKARFDALVESKRTDGNRIAYPGIGRSTGY